MSFLPSLYQSYGPRFMPKFRFRSISREHIDRILPNFIYVSILTRSSLGLLHLNFSHICTRVMVLDLRQNFVFAQYLENSFIEFIQILYVH